jgi:hypothetical protein
MEKLIGKPVAPDGVGEFAKDFLAWAGEHTANARLLNETTGVEVEITCRHNSDMPTVTVRGLAGGGDAAGAWAEASGFDVLNAEPDVLVVEAQSRDATPATTHELASFLSPAGRWRIKDVAARRKA